MKPSTRQALFFAVKVMIVAFIAYIVVMSAIVYYLRVQSDNNPLYVYFICATGITPSNLAFYTYDNGTHTIDMYSCKWIENADPKLRSAEYVEILGMYCSEMLERHESGEPYLGYHSDMLAESKAAGCKILKPQYRSLAELFLPWL